MAVLERGNFFRRGCLFRVILFEVTLVLCFFAIIEGNFIEIVRGGDSHLRRIELVFVEEALLVGVLHHLKILLDVAIEDLAAQRLLVGLHHRLELLPRFILLLLLYRLHVLRLSHSELVLQFNHFLRLLYTLVSAQIRTDFLEV